MVKNSSIVAGLVWHIKNIRITYTDSRLHFFVPVRSSELKSFSPQARFVMAERASESSFLLFCGIFLQVVAVDSRARATTTMMMRTAFCKSMVVTKNNLKLPRVQSSQTHSPA